MLRFSRFSLSCMLYAQNSLWILDDCFLQPHTCIMFDMIIIRIIKIKMWGIIFKNLLVIRFYSVSLCLEISHIFTNYSENNDIQDEWTVRVCTALCWNCGYIPYMKRLSGDIRAEACLHARGGYYQYLLLLRRPTWTKLYVHHVFRDYSLVLHCHILPFCFVVEINISFDGKFD